MGKFDGILLATDWDGTAFYNENIPKRNIEAVKYFKENGGKFTICSGRYYAFLKQFENQLCANTYTVCYNGALIIDLRTEGILYQGFCDNRLETILENLFALNLNYQFINFYDCEHTAPVEYTIDYCKAHLNKICDKKFYKVLLRTDSAENAFFGMKAVNSLKLDDYIAVRSWDKSLEILKKENAKGTAIKRIANILGSKLIVAVGDFENDIDLIKAADIGYAVENACDALKAVANRTTCHAEHGALADVIYEIEREIDMKKLII